jgi:hypothetical protein
VALMTLVPPTSILTNGTYVPYSNPINGITAPIVDRLRPKGQGR